MNKKIIIAILVVIIIAAGAFFMFGQSLLKADTQINLLNRDTIQNGEQLEFELKDANGNPVAGQVLNITFNDKNYSVATDDNGKAYLFITGIDVGKYNVSVSYGGNDKFNGCTATFNIEVTNDAPDNPATRTISNSVVSTQNNQTSGNNTGNSTGNSSGSGLNTISGN